MWRAFPEAVVRIYADHPISLHAPFPFHFILKVPRRK